MFNYLNSTANVTTPLVKCKDPLEKQQHRDDEVDYLEEQEGKIREHRWVPTGNTLRDFLSFAGPGWFVAIAYIDPGNYQADIHAGATSKYKLISALWWTSVLSVYVQILCVRLAYYGQVTLAEAQARNTSSKWMKYLNWFIAEFSIVITDLPEVIGIGIALHIFFGWPYYVGVLLSIITTMMFLACTKFGISILENILGFFVAIMSLALFLELSFVEVETKEVIEGWVFGFKDMTRSDISSMTGILGAVVMPHNLYLHTAACQSRPVKREEEIVQQAIKYCSYELVFPIFVSFFVNVAIVTIAAESVYGIPEADQIGLSDFCNYFKTLKHGCILFGVALLAAGQSSAITTTFTGQYIMDGYLDIKLPLYARAILTRLVAIIPCVIISVLYPDKLNKMVNIVNSLLSILLPFAFTPLIKYNCSEKYLGKFAIRGWERRILYGFAIIVWAMNASALSAVGGGFFGDFLSGMKMSAVKSFWLFLEVMVQSFYAWWNWDCLMTPVKSPMTPLQEERPYDEQFAMSYGSINDSR